MTMIPRRGSFQLFEFALWTRAMVRDLIRQNCGVTLSLASVGRLLRSLGLTPQRPVRRAIEQVPAKVREWLTVDYPAIQAKARKAGAQIFFADEAGVRSNSHHSGTTWAPMGQTPVVPATGKRFGLNLVSGGESAGRVAVHGGRRADDGGALGIAFLKRLLHNQTQPIFLIVDQHSSHRAKAVQEFVASTDGHLELFFLPPYSPELNPDELVWNHLKTHGVRKRLLQTPQELKRYVLGHMRSLQRTPALLRGFFKKPSLRSISPHSVTILRTRSLIAKVRRAGHDSGGEWDARGAFQWSGHVYTETNEYQAGTWNHARRVVIKAEVVRHRDREPRDNPRFVVTNMRQTPRFLYEKVYCARGDAENRIKELKALQIDRTSCQTFSANQLRVLLTAAAYVLMQELRLRAADTRVSRPVC